MLISAENVIGGKQGDNSAVIFIGDDVKIISVSEIKLHYRFAEPFLLRLNFKNAVIISNVDIIKNVFGTFNARNFSANITFGINNAVGTASKQEFFFDLAVRGAVYLFSTQFLE